MNTYTLNIGLRHGDAREVVDLVDTAFDCGITPHEYEVHGNTLVMAVTPRLLSGSVFDQALELCRCCGRDAVAVFDPWRNCGFIVGDYARSYGEFDTAKFHFLSPAPTAH